MKTRLTLLSAALLLALCAGAAAPDLRWSVDTSKAAPADWQLYQGEIMPLAPAFTAYGLNVSLSGATASFLWQTNGMGTSWWSKAASIVTGSPDRVSAVWHPTNDCGASAYAYFIRVALPSSTLYRASGTIKMLHSPGFAPATLPPPSVWPDLAASLAPLVAPLVAIDLTPATNYTDSATNALGRAVTNEAALRASGDLAGSNLVSSAIAQLASTQQLASTVSQLATTQALAAAVSPLATTQQLAAALSALPPGSADALRLVDSTNSPSQWIDGFGNVWTNYTSTRVFYLNTDSYPSTYVGESWGFYQTVDGTSYYTNGARPSLTWTSSIGENGGYWSILLAAPPEFGLDAASDAPTLHMLNGNEEMEQNFERQEIAQGTVVMIVDNVARKSELDSLPLGQSEAQVESQIASHVFSSVTLSSPITNALLRLIWDPTNQTLAAQEILP